MSVLNELTTRLAQRKADALSAYRGSVAVVASGGKLTAAALEKLTDALERLQVDPDTFAADVAVWTQVEVLKAKVAELPDAKARDERDRKHRERVAELKKQADEINAELRGADPMYTALLANEAALTERVELLKRSNDRLFGRG